MTYQQGNTIIDILILLVRMWLWQWSFPKEYRSTLEGIEKERQKIRP